MALLYLDSFDHYSATQLALKGWLTDNAAGTIDASGRFAQSFMFQATTTARSQYRTFTAAQTVIVGLAYRVTSQNDGGNSSIIAIRDSGSTQGRVYLNTALHLVLETAGVARETSDFPLLPGVWYYIELRLEIANAGGYAEVRVNEVFEMSYTGDTQTSANATANQLQMSKAGGSGDLRVDDLYICDGTGGVNDDFLGDIRVEALFPNGNGNSSQFDGSDGNTTDNYLLVDDTTSPDGDTTYVQSPDAGDKDTYAYTNLTPATGTVYGLQIVPYARKTDAGARSIVSVARHSGSETDGPVQALSTSFVYYPDIRETKPGGGSWSISDVNGAEFGQKVNA